MITRVHILLVALSMVIPAHATSSIRLFHEGLLAFSAAYQCKEYGSLFYEFYTDPEQRSVNYKEFIRHGFYDCRHPTRIHPWVPSLGLAFILAYELLSKQYTKPTKPRIINKKSTKDMVLYEGGKIAMASSITLFWYRTVSQFGSKASAFCVSSPIAPLSLYLAGSTLLSSSKKLLDHIFLHRTKKARPC